MTSAERGVLRGECVLAPGHPGSCEFAPAPLPTDEDREALWRLIHRLMVLAQVHTPQEVADAILAAGFRRSVVSSVDSQTLRVGESTVVSTPSEEERKAREFLAEHYTPDVGWTVEELHVTVLVPQSILMVGNGEALRLVRDILDEAAFDIKVVERSAVSAPPTITDADEFNALTEGTIVRTRLGRYAEVAPWPNSVEKSLLHIGTEVPRGMEPSMDLPMTILEDGNT